MTKQERPQVVKKISMSFIIWMLLKVKGDMLEDQWEFIGTKVIGAGLDHQMAIALYPLSDTEEGEQSLVIQYNAPEGMTFLEGGRMELRLDDILVRGPWPEEGEEPAEPVIVRGAWALPFNLEPIEEQEVLTAACAVVPARNTGSEQPEGPIEIRDIRVTMTGVSFVENEPDPEIELAYLISDVTGEIFLQMKDGLEFRVFGENPV